MNIKEIALKLTQKLSIAINDDEAIEFATAIIAEIAKQNEPVAWMHPEEGLSYENHYTGNIPLYTFPPTAEQIANETSWQPIETAPKDGTDILCCGWLYNQPKNGWFHAVCWWNGYGFVDDGGDVDFVTHWMPLPTLPQRGMEGV